MVDAKGVHIILRAVSLLRGEGFTGFTVELNGDNLRFASEGVRKEIEDFLSPRGRAPAGGPDRYPQRVLPGGPAGVAHGTDRLVHGAVYLVGEIFGLVISEAWMFGKPVICSNIGGPAERIQHDVDGLHFQMGNAKALAETIRRACTEEGIWGRLVAALPETSAGVRRWWRGIGRRIGASKPGWFRFILGLLPAVGAGGVSRLRKVMGSRRSAARRVGGGCM